MLETPHVVVGAAIASKIPNPLISIPLALASHFILDKTPHWNPHLNTELKKFGKVTDQSKLIVVIDVIFALASGLYITSLAGPNVNHQYVVLAASFTAVLPDVIEAPHFFLNPIMKNKFIKTGSLQASLVSRWIAFQKSIQNDTSPILGLGIQIATMAAAFIWIFN